VPHEKKPTKERTGEKETEAEQRPGKTLKEKARSQEIAEREKFRKISKQSGSDTKKGRRPPRELSGKEA